MHRKIAFGTLLTCVMSAVSISGFSQAGNSYCNKIKELPSVEFKSKSSSLLPSAKNILNSVSSMMKESPSCKVVVTGYGAQSKTGHQLSWDHTQAVINYLVEKQGISMDRFIFRYGEDGDPTIVDLKAAAAGEDGPSSVSPPFPSLRRS